MKALVHIDAAMKALAKATTVAEVKNLRDKAEAMRTPPLFTGARDVDHVVPLRDGGAQYELSNLQPLCRRCHQQKTNRETRERHGASI